ncbi:MAG: hypothetical protein ACK5WM_23565 [Rhodospirillales bacterium]
MTPIARLVPIAIAAMVLLAPAVPRAQPAGPAAEPIALDRGAVTIRGTIRGEESRRLVLDLSAAQTLRLTRESPNGAATMNVWAPDSDTAMVIGSVTGPDFDGPVPTTGGYTVDLYLMRSAARRNEAAPFTLTIGVGAR